MISVLCFLALSLTAHAEDRYLYPAGGAEDILVTKPASLRKTVNAANCIDPEGRIVPPGSEDYRDCILRKEKQEKPEPPQPRGLEIPLSK
ncbi:MAG: hypothetical protein ACXVCH_17165 [Bdellovibrionota bacterium]